MFNGSKLYILGGDCWSSRAAISSVSCNISYTFALSIILSLADPDLSSLTLFNGICNDY
jgi:hypothetical protein